jgi:hypothetical protein
MVVAVTHKTLLFKSPLLCFRQEKWLALALIVCFVEIHQSSHTSNQLLILSKSSSLHLQRCP